MVRAWYMDDDPSDQRYEHHKNPPQFISLEDLYKVSGVEYFKLNRDTIDTDGSLEKIKKDRGYTYEDQITCSKECLLNYEEKLKIFFTEHLHIDEEIRLVIEGSGYFDVRDISDEWIRVEVVPGDLLIIPSGIYHRFTLDTKNFIRARRLFVGEPVWTPYNRPCDEMEARKSKEIVLKTRIVITEDNILHLFTSEKTMKTLQIFSQQEEYDFLLTLL